MLDRYHPMGGWTNAIPINPYVLPGALHAVFPTSSMVAYASPIALCGAVTLAPNYEDFTMNHSKVAKTICALLFACAALPVLAADTAKGSLKRTSEGKTVGIAINHVYYITGPDSFAPEQTTRRLIFATEDTRAAIDACTTASCAMTSIGDGMTVELEWDTPMARWWVHLPQAQQSGMGNASMLSLSTDTPERVAGTLKINSLGVETNIVFDAGLVNAFDK